MLLGLVSVTEGTATFGGRRYVELDHPIHHVGAVLEATSFHPSRRAEDHLKSVAIGAGVPLQRVDETLELVGLAGEARRRVGKFSLGMRQRLQLATALLGDPEILILDEPSNGLDPQGIQWLRTFIRHQASVGHAVLVSSHLLSEMEETVDDVVIVSHGRLVLQTTLAELATRAGTSTGMRIRTPEMERLRAVLDAIPVAYSQSGPDTMTIDGATPEWFGPLAAQHQIVLYELVHDRGTLEDVFLSLTHGFDAADPTLMGVHHRRHARGCGVIAIMRSEWLKLRTTAVPWVLTGIALLVNALLILVIFLTRPDVNVQGGPAPGYTIPHTTQQLRNLVGLGVSGLPLRPPARDADRHDRVPPQDRHDLVPGHAGPLHAGGGKAAHRRRARGAAGRDHAGRAPSSGAD